MNVRHIATSYTGRIAAVAAFGSSVATWDLTTGSRLAQFETVLDFGGRRLAIDAAGERCAAAAYDRGGLACHSPASGVIAWNRTDLRRLQFVGFSHDGRRLFCGSGERPCAVLDAASGAQLDALHGVRRVWESPFSSIRLLDSARLKLTGESKERSASIERTTFAVLDAAFAPAALCISESGGPVRCLDLAGRELWRHVPEPGRHLLDLIYTEASGSFAGVDRPYETGGSRRLLRFDRATGATTRLAEIGCPAEAAFFASGARLLTSDGAVWDVVRGILVDRLAFDAPASSAHD